MDELPYRAEYSKSSRAKCKLCKLQIEKEILRLAVMTQSPFFDGKQPNWYHHSCFFSKQRPTTSGDIAHFESLRWEDQEMIKKKIAAYAGGGGPVPDAPKVKGKANKRASTAASSSSTNGTSISEFSVEYAKSGRALCRGCEEKILKDNIRISKKDYESEEARRYGGLDRWHHLSCFAEIRASLDFWESGVLLPGYKNLESDDQKEIKTVLPKIEKPANGSKVKDEVDGPSKPKVVKTEVKSYDETKAREQNKIMFKYRDQLKANLSKKQCVEMLKHNKQDIPVGEERVLDRLSDIMAFGVLGSCTKCSGGQYVYRSGVGYQCQGDLTEWVKCQDINVEPKRNKFKVPHDLKEEFGFLSKYKSKTEKREIIFNAPTASTSGKSGSQDSVDGGGPRVYRPAPPLKNMEIVILGQTNKDKDELKSQITKLGGKVVTKIHAKLGFVISNLDEIDKMNKRMEEVKQADVQVVKENILDEIKTTCTPEAVHKVIKTLNIASWGSDPKSRVPIEDPKKSVSKFSKSGSMYTKSVPTKVKLKLKGGAYVDPDSELDQVAHVYKHKDGEYYNAVLGLADIQSKKNSYYKLQILEADKGNKYWLFRSWGRIGTTIGGNKSDKVDSLQDALHQFEQLYHEKSGNPWHKRKDFVKVSGKMYPMDVDYGGEDEAPAMLLESDVPSSLAKPVQDLIKMLFDVDTMKKVMLEFELDLEKMPLGKISQTQMREAYVLLTKLQEAIVANSADVILMDLSNRFFTLVPHSFGIDNLPLLNTDEQIKQKIEMLSTLMDIEIAYKLLRSGDKESDSKEHPIDVHYKKLNTDIKVLDKSTEEFILLQKYVKNTHAATHTQYELEIDEIFKVSRHNEAKRYKAYKKKLTNRKLLWHGSRVTNFAGILSQGLRIAPPEAPVTGYMFGKGIYFADMVSKSANYCCTSKSNPTGLLLLCEVALGNMCERFQAEAFVKPPAGFYSVKGVGLTGPDPNLTHVTADGVEIPLGPGVKGTQKCSLLYNEYIVYDTNQLEIQYLLKMKFKHQF